MARRPALPGVDRRQQILEAALDVFAEEGFEGATTKEIAARADVTQGLIYFYFPGKDKLFFAAFEHYAKQALARLHFPAPEECAEPPDAVIRRTLAQFVEVLDSPRSLSLSRIMLRVAVHGEERMPCGSALEEGRKRIRAQGQAIGQSLQRYLDQEIARGALRPVDTALAAQLVIGSLLTTLMRRAAGDATLAHLSREQVVDTIAGLFLYGLVPQSDAPADRLAPHRGIARGGRRARGAPPRRRGASSP